MGVWALRTCAISLSRSGSRWSTTTNAQSFSAGIASKKLLSASIPPADAPRPTIWTAAWPSNLPLAAGALLWDGDVFDDASDISAPLAGRQMLTAAEIL